MLEFVGTLCIGSSLLSRTADLGLVFILLPFYIFFKKRLSISKDSSKRPRLRALAEWILRVPLLLFAFVSALTLLGAVVFPLTMIQYAVNFVESPINLFYLWLLHLARPLGYEEDVKQSVRDRMRDARLGTLLTPSWLKGDALKLIDETSEQVDRLVPGVIGRRIPFVGLAGVIVIIVAFAIK